MTSAAFASPATVASSSKTRRRGGPLLGTAVDLRNRVRPFLKWAGGKSQLLPEILAQFPQQFGCYHEPFLGGGAVFLALNPKRAILSDINVRLIDTYASIRDDVDAVIEALQEHRSCSEHYYQVRAQAPHNLDLDASAARIIYLNRTCFNGLYRENRKGEFNVPFGRYNNPTICDAENLRRVSGLLKRARLRHRSVFHMGRQVQRGDLVYFDPPYDPVSKTASFTQYAGGGFGRLEQIRLAQLFRRLAARGVHVVLSNSDTPLVRELYADFPIKAVRARRAINSRADRRGTVGEVLVTSVRVGA